MSWERDPLWAKAKLFFQHALNTDRDDPVFGLWCSLGMELLARAALASVSPTLLAQPESNQRNLLHVVHPDSELLFPKSISATLVFDLCGRMFPAFTDDDRKVASALLNRRNAELHSGAAAFQQYQPSQWLAGFYRACHSLATVLDQSLEDLFGETEAKFAQDLLAENRKNIKQKVLSTIAAHKKVFDGRIATEQEEARRAAAKLGEDLSTQRHHRVICPACGCTAMVQGRPFGKEHVTHGDDDEIIVKQAVSPTEFACSACELHLSTFAELEVAGVADHYTRTTMCSADEYYGLIHPDDVDSYLAAQAEDFMGYDNE